MISCDLCHKNYGLKTALISHKLKKHKLIDKQVKTSALIADSAEAEDFIYSSDSECEYRIVTKVERIPKIQKPNDIKLKTTFECIHCKKVYKNKSNLRSHLAYNHRSKQTAAISEGSATKTFHCKHCDKIFNRRLHYEHHLRNHRKDTPFFCKTCQSGFNAKPELLLHKRNNPQCQNAPKSKQFLCTYCGKYFERKNSLTIHTRIHTNEKPFECIECGKSFIMKSTLREHMNSIHLGVKAYACPVEGCDKQFGFASGLRQHRLNMHEPPKFKCPFCERMFAKKIHME